MFYDGSIATASALDKNVSILSLIDQISLSYNQDDLEQSIKALIAYEDRDFDWIVDFGATGHMTYDKSLFQSVTPPLK